MIPGITDKEMEIIKSIFKDYDVDFYLYGSRVKGDFSPLSDLDVLVKSKFYEDIIYDLKAKFDNSSLPYVVNFTNFYDVDDKFYNLIKDNLKKI